jgi:hypothetical protein
MIKFVSNRLLQSTADHVFESIRSSPALNKLSQGHEQGRHALQAYQALCLTLSCSRFVFIILNSLDNPFSNNHSLCIHYYYSRATSCLMQDAHHYAKLSH